ncbi:MAG: tetratricopeptide repeat protein [Burkholderiales bacterium]
MALKDKRGLEISTANRTSVDRLETATELLNGYFGDPLAAIDRALADDPDFIMGHCFRAGLAVTSSEKAAEPMLRESVEAVEARWKHTNDRERRHILAAGAWLRGDFHRANNLYGDLTIDYPHDLFALQVAHLTDFLLGQSNLLRDRIARVLPHWTEDMPGYGYVLGMYAFGLEENADYARAEDFGRRAVATNPRDAWAIHAITHVMEMQGRQADGIAWLTCSAQDWSRDNFFAYHNWWHLSLFHLDLEQNDRVLQLYDAAIRRPGSGVAMELVDATALLWRLHLRGLDVGERWREVADGWEAMAGDAYYAFNDTHAMMAFVADGRTDAQARLLAAMEKGAAGNDSNAMMTREVGLPLARAVQAFGRDDYRNTIALIEPVRPVAHRFGGSHAQRDIVSLTLIEAAMRACRGNLARALAAERTYQKPVSPFNWRAIARAEKLLGHPVRTEAAQREAETLKAQRAPRHAAMRAAA